METLNSRAKQEFNQSKGSFRGSRSHRSVKAGGEEWLNEQFITTLAT